MTMSCADPPTVLLEIVPWFIIKQTQIEMDTIGDPSRECFHGQNG